MMYQNAEAGYFEKRTLRRHARVLHLWALGVAAVISGDFFGWNFGLTAGGFEGMVIALAVMTVMYGGLCFFDRGDVRRRCRMRAARIRSLGPAFGDTAGPWPDTSRGSPRYGIPLDAGERLWWGSADIWGDFRDIEGVGAGVVDRMLRGVRGAECFRSGAVVRFSVFIAVAALLVAGGVLESGGDSACRF